MIYPTFCPKCPTFYPLPCPTFLLFGHQKSVDALEVKKKTIICYCISIQITINPLSTDGAIVIQVILRYNIPGHRFFSHFSNDVYLLM